MATGTRRRRDRLTPTQARAARRMRRHRRKRFVRFGAFVAIATVAGLFILSLFAGSLPITIGSPSGDAGQRLSDLGTNHISRGDSHEPYNSVPATSGWHYADVGSPTRWGIHNEVVPDEVLVHNLEHGGVGVHYNCPDGCSDLVEKLSDIVERANKVVMSPYPDMDTTIVLTAWNYIDEFDEFDEERITNFIGAHVNSHNAPEWQAP